MRRSVISSRNSGTFPRSPGTSNSWESSVVKGWSSERVPPPTTCSCGHMGASVLMTLNSGKTLPSKWEDAERWITSPGLVSENGTSRASLVQPQRRPKSKSGPLSHPGTAGYSIYSPAVPLLECGSVKSFTVGSPFSTGVMFADSPSIHYGTRGESHPPRSEHSIARSASLPGWADALGKSSLPSSQEDKLDSTNDETMVSGAVSRRDMATQMSPISSTTSSPTPGEGSQISTSRSSFLPVSEPPSDLSAKLVVRDVQVDRGATVTLTRWSKKHGSRTSKKSTPNVEDLYRKASEAQTEPWVIAEAAKNISNYQREEARITAWETLQKAKAEAAIQKLEMKLEKKRSSSMDKIVTKLRTAQIKAQGMRSSISEAQVHEVPKTLHKVASYIKNVRKGSLGGCFNSRAL